jgi:hypothetical protein
VEKSSLALSQIFGRSAPTREGRRVRATCSRGRVDPQIGQYPDQRRQADSSAVLLMASRLGGYDGDRSILYAAVVSSSTPPRSSTTTSSTIRTCGAPARGASLGQRHRRALDYLYISRWRRWPTTLEIIGTCAMSRCG